MDGLLQHAPQFLTVAGLAVICYLLMRRTSSRKSESFREKGQAVPGLFPEKDRDQTLRDAPTELVRWQVQMHETARDLKAEIDTKMLALQALINVAREEQEKLESAIQRATAARGKSPRSRESAEPDEHS